MSSKNPFAGAKFDVEHALDLYADSFCTFDAPKLYEKKFVRELRATGRAFHIYMIGYVPEVKPIKTYREGDELCIIVAVAGKESKLSWTLPAGAKLKRDGTAEYVEDAQGNKRWPDQSSMWRQMHVATGGFPFKVKYIGQAYGSKGARNALDRLLKHETLQKISVKGVPPGQALQILLIELNEHNRIFTVFLPDAQTKDDHGVRRKQGLDKLFGTTDAERVSLYEAALIRYFSPEFNKEFKDSFPSTNLKILQDCYEKDFLAVVAQICIDDFPYCLCSEAVEPKFEHIVTYDLHNDTTRRAFFGMDAKPPGSRGR